MIDPTPNVMALVEAANKRQDDLRERDRLHAETIMRLRAEHERELRATESARLDAIRKVDNEAVIRAATVQTEQASTLALQVATSAEALRNQVAAAATAQTIALNAALDPIQKRIDDLTRAQYEAQGQKTQVVESRSSGSFILAGIVAAAVVVSTMLAVVGFVVVQLVGSP